ncbi:CDP-alcohol phosphatidyltransferase family protein [Actinacidiphila glaucinigra]|nr:CDP-alcohol phosphatidyltransferase family protein [Actinacidiphila glaucinigra]WSD58938.1 CDP-alcohol phosphatidyltransferase family protein [Actinacidiphila glaucinigra]
MTVMTVGSEFRGGTAGREQAGAAAAQLALFAALWATVGLDTVGWLAGTVYAAGTWALLAAGLRRAGRRSLGPADHVTLARAVLVGGVTAMVAGGVAHGTPLLTGLTAVALALDAVDGKVARRTGTSSALGARFDMEVDAFLILVLSARLALTLGPWVLVIGAMRYAFVAAAWVLPWLNAPLPPSFARKTVAALQGVVLLAACSGLLPAGVSAALTVLALASLVWSFGRDVLWLWRHRPAPRSGSAAGLAGAGGAAEERRVLVSSAVGGRTS